MEDSGNDGYCKTFLFIHVIYMKLFIQHTFSRNITAIYQYTKHLWACFANGNFHFFLFFVLIF